MAQMRKSGGWYYESTRHSLAAQGISTGRRYNGVGSWIATKSGNIWRGGKALLTKGVAKTATKGAELKFVTKLAPKTFTQNLDVAGRKVMLQQQDVLLKKAQQATAQKLIMQNERAVQKSLAETLTRNALARQGVSNVDTLTTRALQKSYAPTYRLMEKEVLGAAKGAKALPSVLRAEGKIAAAVSRSGAALKVSQKTMSKLAAQYLDDMAKYSSIRLTGAERAAILKKALLIAKTTGSSLDDAIRKAGLTLGKEFTWSPGKAIAVTGGLGVAGIGGTAWAAKTYYEKGARTTDNVPNVFDPSKVVTENGTTYYILPGGERIIWKDDGDGVMEDGEFFNLDGSPWDESIWRQGASNVSGVGEGGMLQAMERGGGYEEEGFNMGAIVPIAVGVGALGLGLSAMGSGGGGGEEERRRREQADLERQAAEINARLAREQAARQIEEIAAMKAAQLRGQ